MAECDGDGVRRVVRPRDLFHLQNAPRHFHDLMLVRAAIADDGLLDDIPEQPEVRDYDPDLALYGGSADGTLIPERIIARAAKLLRAGGLMVMEHDITQGERLAAFARTCGFVDVTVHNDYTGRPRYLTAEKQPAQ